MRLRLAGNENAYFWYFSPLSMSIVPAYSSFSEIRKATFSIHTFWRMAVAFPLECGYGSYINGDRDTKVFSERWNNIASGMFLSTP
jgi:hypothetical protein